MNIQSFREFLHSSACRIILRYELTRHTPEVSSSNNIVNAYIHDWDGTLSRNNHISNAQLDFRPPNLKEKPL